MRKTLFTIDGVDAIFEGYAEEGHWNGWAKPWFTKEVGMKIVEIFNKGAHPIKDSYMRYDAENDIFIRKDICYDEPEIYKGYDVDGMHLYPIGNMCWIWDNLADYQNEQSKMVMEYLQDVYHYLDCEQLHDAYYGIIGEINGYMTEKEVKIFADGFMTAFDRSNKK